MDKETILLKALELAYAEIESLKQQVDDLACDYADVQNDLSETRRELKALMYPPKTMSTSDAIKHLEQELKDDGHETL